MEVNDSVLEAAKNDVAAVLGDGGADPRIEQLLDLGDDCIVLFGGAFAFAYILSVEDIPTVIAKFMLTIAMLLGRLEFFPLLVLFNRNFWR